MPIYTYYCLHCRVDVELIQVPVDDRDNQKCPYCKQELRRVIDLPGLTWGPTRGT